MSAAFRNWSGLVSCRPMERREPASLDELRDAVRAAASAGRTLRVVGSGHSFTPLVETDGVLVSLDRLAGLASVDAAAGEATILGGTKLHALGDLLEARGLGLINQGDVDAQSLAGAISTGTHGTGASLGSLSTQVSGLTLVKADGGLLECSPEREPEVFDAARVSLGALGVIACVRLKLRPAFKLLEIKRNMGLEACLAELGALREAHRHFEFLWFPHTDRVSAKTLDVTEAPITASAVRRVLVDLLLENGAFWLLSDACRLRPALCASVSRLSARLVSEGRRVDRSARVFASPRLVRFNEMEYAVAVERGPDCLRELRDFVARSAVRVHFPVEYRFVAADEIWLSPFHRRQSAVVSVHMYRGMPFESYFAGAEAIFRNHGGRPHWGKLHTLTSKDLAELYPMWDRFQALRRSLDPQGVFLNPYLKRILGA